MRQQKILRISGNQNQAIQIDRHLHASGYQVFEAACGEIVPKLLLQVQPQLALLDWNLPDVSALAVIRAIRAQAGFAKLPIILIGREISCENKILSLEAGVDYCLDGAVFPKELIARVRALLRRAAG